MLFFAYVVKNHTLRFLRIMEYPKNRKQILKIVKVSVQPQLNISCHWIFRHACHVTVCISRLIGYSEQFDVHTTKDDWWLWAGKDTTRSLLSARDVTAARIKMYDENIPLEWERVGYTLWMPQGSGNSSDAWPCSCIISVCFVASGYSDFWALFYANASCGLGQNSYGEEIGKHRGKVEEAAL